MKYLPWLTAMFVACQPLLACSSDNSDVGSNAGAPSAGRGGGAAGSPSAGAPSSSKAGAPGAAGAAGAASGEAGSGGAGIEAGAGGSAGTSEAKDIVETAVAAGSFTKLAAALTAADLVETLQGPGPFTVFAPDDAAFAAFETANPGVLAGLSKAELTTILTYHVIAGSAAAKDLKNNQVLVTVSGSPVLIDKTTGVKLSDGAKVDDASVTSADIVASNGIIHVIDFVITPPTKDIVETAVAAGTFSKLASALTSAGLVDTLKGKGPFTVFAPTDTAFTGVTAPTGDALANLLKYHVVGAAAGSGDLTDKQSLTTLDTATSSKLTVDLSSGVKIKDSTATAATVAPANILAKNGVIHVVDKVLIPN
ncbi:MAG TPA: fasciclin domain-containing protein [Polyangiaceae bacterium]|nr:fasciclin domain-containing protein [Polyangiaceae bacterium]